MDRNKLLEEKEAIAREYEASIEAGKPDEVLYTRLTRIDHELHMTSHQFPKATEYSSYSVLF